MLVIRAEAAIKAREEKQREEVRQDFEQINIQIAGEDAGIDSEEECHNVEIIHGEPRNEFAPIDLDVESVHEDYESDLVSYLLLLVHLLKVF